MIISLSSILIHYCLTETTNLTFIGCHNIWLEYFRVVVTTSVCALSCHKNGHVCAITLLYRIHYVNSYLRRNFIIDGYGIFPPLRWAISYPRTMSAYNLCICFSFYFVSMMYPVLSPYVSMLDLILSPPVFTLDSISSSFDLTLTKFITLALSRI